MNLNAIRPRRLAHVLLRLLSGIGVQLYGINAYCLTGTLGQHQRQ